MTRKKRRKEGVVALVRLVQEGDTEREDRMITNSVSGWEWMNVLVVTVRIDSAAVT